MAPAESTSSASQENGRLAVRLTGVRKEYRLYDSFSDQALDVLGVSWLRFWRPVDRRTFTALDSIDLEVNYGERIGIVGRNGAGKTTMLKLITGNFAPTAGELEINGAVQALMQTGLGFHGDFTGEQNIRSSLIYNGVSGAELEAAYDDVVEFCELEDFLNQPVRTYSLGMRARLQFAVATAIKPEIVIIDEVLGAGDAYFAGKSSERIQRLTGQGATLLIVSHSMDQILRFSSRVIWLDKGSIVASGTPLEIVNQYEEFIHKLERSKRTETGEATGTDESPESMRDIPRWFLEKQGSAFAEGADWGGDGPLRIVRLGVVDKDEQPIEVLPAMQPFGFVAEIESNEIGVFPCSCLFVMYNEAGDVVTRVVEPERDYSFDGQIHRIVAWVDDNPIGAGKYVVSSGLYRDYNILNPARGHRYHILSRGIQLRITSSSRDNSSILLRPTWMESVKDPESVGDSG